MSMHPTTRAAVITALAAELSTDPAARGYAGKTAAEILVLLSESVEIAAPPTYRDVPVSSVEGYMRLRRHIVRLRRWVASQQEPSDLSDFAAEMLDMMAAANVQVFETSVPAKRTAILAAFAGLAEVGAGGFSAQSVADLTAMTNAPPGPSTWTTPRWSVVINGIGGTTVIDEEAGTRTEWHGPPNLPDETLIAEALS